MSIQAQKQFCLALNSPAFKLPLLSDRRRRVFRVLAGFEPHVALPEEAFLAGGPKKIRFQTDIAPVTFQRSSGAVW